MTERFFQLLIENVKRIKFAQVNLPAVGLQLVTGKNGSGKTTLLDCLKWALAGSDDIQTMPIRKGAESARIRLALGDIIVTRKFTAKGSTVTVENADGAKYPSPQKMLDALMSRIAFDPMQFLQMSPEQQYDELMKVSEIAVDIDALDAANDADYEKRRDLNRLAKEKRTIAKTFDFEFEDSINPVDLAAIADEMKAASDANAANATEQRNRKKTENQAKNTAAVIAEIERQLAEFKERLHTSRNELQGLTCHMELWQPIPTDIDLSPFRDQIKLAEAKNREYARRRELSAINAMAETWEETAETLTAQMGVRQQQCAEAIASAKMPVPGLTPAKRVITKTNKAGVTTEEKTERFVALNGIPFDQCSSAEQLRTSIAVVMAGDPKVRIARVTEGSLLDEEGLATVAQMAVDRDFLVVMERVDSSGKVGIVMEDGAVVSKEDQEDVQQAKLALEEIARDEAVPWEEVKQQLGLETT